MARTSTSARAWLDDVLDPGWTPLFEDVLGDDPLAWPGYADQLERARERTGASESVLIAEGTVLGDIRVVVIAFEFGFLGGSMGIAAGERISRAFERAADQGVPVLASIATGGARMQEGMRALAQMPATLNARARLAAAGQPFIAYLRNPSTGGVVASFASTADLAWAEPNATVAFAGSRVAEVVTDAPDDAPRTAEEALRAGMIDQLVPPGELKGMLLALRWLRPSSSARPAAMPTEPPPRDEPAMDMVERARTITLDPVPGAMPLRGRARSVRGGLTQIDGRNVVSIEVRGRDTVTAQGFRSARHAIALAERLGLPVVTFIDTPGADPSARAEADAIATEIATTMAALLAAHVPTVACVIGEGGSGGALAFAACDRLLIARDATFSVIAPEAAAAILKRDDVAAVAAELKPTAHDLRALGLADLVIDSPDDADAARAALHAAVGWALSDIGDGAPTERRRTRWRTR